MEKAEYVVLVDGGTQHVLKSNVTLTEKHNVPVYRKVALANSIEDAAAIVKASNEGKGDG